LNILYKKYKNIKILISYNGTKYNGFQKQRINIVNVNTLENSILKILYTINKIKNYKKNKIIVAGRTDKGVHAEEQIISFILKTNINNKNLFLTINNHLPVDIIISRINEISFIFNAKQYNIGKKYIYNIYNNIYKNIFISLFSWHIKNNINLLKIKRSKNIFIGEKDFTSFRNSQCQFLHAIRHIWFLNILYNNNIITINIYGNAFCHNMIRIIINIITNIGLNKKNIYDIKYIFYKRDRKLIKETAPSNGLILKNIFYPNYIKKSKILKKKLFPKYPISKQTWPFRRKYNINIYRKYF